MKWETNFALGNVLIIFSGLQSVAIDSLIVIYINFFNVMLESFFIWVPLFIHVLFLNELLSLSSEDLNFSKDD